MCKSITLQTSDSSLLTEVFLCCRTITLTRKLFTMLLSVIVYNHTLTTGQWGGAAVVFAAAFFLGDRAGREITAED